MARHKTPTKKQTMAMDLITQGMSPTEAMRKAGYSKASTRIPKQVLLKSAGVTGILQVMQGQLLDSDINGIYLAERLAEFAKNNNPKVFFMAYDRIAKIVGIEPSAKDVQTPKRQVTFTEWVDNPTQQEKEEYKDTNMDDLIALDSIKLDRFDNPENSESIDPEPLKEDQEEIIY